jgi:TRAP-type C4-dicarboxylate transport system substrate-binding protein
MSAMAQDVTLKMHQFLPPQANVPKLVLDPWARKVEQASGGTIKIDHYPSMQLGGTPPQLIDQALDGVADIVWTVVGYTPGRFPSTEVFELPFMMTDAPTASRAFWRMFNTHMKDSEFKDLQILGTWVHGAGLIHAAAPVTTPDDLQGLKIRGGSRSVNMLLEQFGATPVGLPAPAIPEALSKGVIDATTLPWEVTTSLKVPELVEYHTEFTGPALYTLTFVLAMNKAKFDGLTKAQQQAILAHSGEELSASASATMQQMDIVARDYAMDLGNEVTTLDATSSAEWQALSQPVYDAWIAEVAKKGIDGQALIDEAQSLMADIQN